MFRHTPGMVGDPKTLQDLYRIDAQVRVTCTGCKAVEVWELSDLIEEVRRNGGSDDWHRARYAVKCPRHCPSPMIQLLPLPFGKQRARQRDYRHQLINLALQILREAAARGHREPIGTIEVRLALHVLRPFVRRSELLAAYWKMAILEQRHPWTSCHLPYRHIAERLIALDVEVDAANRP